MIYKFLTIQLIIVIGLRMKSLSSTSTQVLYFSPNYIKGYDETAVHRVESIKTSIECALLCTKDSQCKGFVLLTEKTSKKPKICKLLNAKQQCVAEDSVYDVAYFEPRELNASSHNEWKIVERYGNYVPAQDFNEIWDSDCYQGPCDSKGIVGFRDSGAVNSDIDFVICGSHNEDFQLIPTSGRTVQISSTVQSTCATDQIATAVWDSSSYWDDIDTFKCLDLSPEWTIDTKKCTVVALVGLFKRCPDTTNGYYYYVTGIWKTVDENASHFKCCPVTRKVFSTPGNLVFLQMGARVGRFVFIFNSRKKKKTVNQVVYREQMCPQMFQDLNLLIQNQLWTWQQDGATAHTAIATVNWLLENTPAMIVPANWPSKSPDLNVLDYCMWSILLSKLQQQRGHITDIERLKEVLTEAWNVIPQTTIQETTPAWIKRLYRCVEVHGSHFEHY